MNIASRCPPFTTHLYSHCTRTRNYVDEQELTQIELVTNLMCTLTFLILNQLQNIVLYFFPLPFLSPFLSLFLLTSWQAVQHELGDSFSLGSYLIKPFQRITKYRLFLEVGYCLVMFVFPS